MQVRAGRRPSLQDSRDRSKQPLVAYGSFGTRKRASQGSTPFLNRRIQQVISDVQYRILTKVPADASAILRNVTRCRAMFDLDDNGRIDKAELGKRILTAVERTVSRIYNGVQTTVPPALRI